ncbi:MAG: hypothetical protein ACI9VR_003215 [Cognaticolwellia sp.]|jgi:hypothetical protein
MTVLGLALAVGALKRKVARQALTRILGRVELRAGESAWSAWLPGRRVVVMDPKLSPGDHALTLRHELQHHRQGDRAGCDGDPRHPRLGRAGRERGSKPLLPPGLCRLREAAYQGVS